MASTCYPRVGNVPIDAEDEGFESIDLDAAIDDVHQYLLSAVNEYEVKIAAAIGTGMKS